MSTTPRARREFSWSPSDEPHAIRRKQILEKYPEVEKLMADREPLTFWYTLAFFSIQMIMVYLVKDANWFIMILASYSIGGTINHSLQLASHELSHNTCWSSGPANKMTAIFANLATGFPSAITFQRYHMDHHAYQGVDGVDTDVPTFFETQWFQSTPAKTLWLLLNPLWYSLRPLFVKPKNFMWWEGVNWICQLTFDVFIIYVAGASGFCYLWMGTLLGLGLHPAAGHFIAEHYELTTGYETYSYYGPWNYINFNVGYHNEHHDFPRMPWTKLPLLKKMAPEFYDTLPCYSSYFPVMWAFLTDNSIGPWARIKRQPSASIAKMDEESKKKHADGMFKWIAAGALILTILCGVAFTITKLL